MSLQGRELPVVVRAEILILAEVVVRLGRLWAIEVSRSARLDVYFGKLAQL
jgi:hypothetical protein